MPWTMDNPPGPVKNKSDEQKQKCIRDANAVIREGGSETDAIRACIKAAGMTKNPGGKGSLALEIPDDISLEALEKLFEATEEMGLGFVTFEAASAPDFEIEYDGGQMVALGAVDPEIDWSTVRALYFRNAILARQETNKNRDHLPDEEIDALALSIGGMPIDDEHRFREIIGVFTRGQRTDDGGTGAVATDGLIWASRFPEIAKEVATGERKLSMEVFIARATCSVCGETYNKKDDYCEHLRTKQSERHLHGVKGFGGAATKKPAGSATMFDADHLMVVASDHSDYVVESIDIHDEGDYLEIMGVVGGWYEPAEGKQLSYQQREDLGDKQYALIQTRTNQRTGEKMKVRRFPINDCEHARKALQLLPKAKEVSSSERAAVKRKAQAKLNSDACRRQSASEKGGGSTMTDEERIQELEEKLSAAETKVADLEGAIATANSERDAAQQSVADLRWSLRQQMLLAAGVEKQFAEEKKDVLANLDDEAFELFLGTLAKKEDAPPDDGKQKDQAALGSLELGTGKAADRPPLILA